MCTINFKPCFKYYTSREGENTDGRMTHCRQKRHFSDDFQIKGEASIGFSSSELSEARWGGEKKTELQQVGENVICPHVIPSELQCR